MYSVHGWATIWPTYKNDDSVAGLLDQMDALRNQIVDCIQRLGLDRTEQRMNPFAEICPLNNEMHLWLSGNNNHAQWHEAIMDLFAYIANFVESGDPFLSPRFPMVEDPAPESRSE